MMKNCNSNESKIEQLLKKAIEAYKKDDCALAKKIFTEVLNFDPENILALGVLGTFFLDEKKYKKAQDCFEKILKIDPNHSLALSQMAEVFIEQENYKKAQEYLEKVLRANPKDINSLGLIGSIYIDERKYKKAKECFEKILLINPKEIRAYTLLAEMYRRQRQYTKAKKCLEKALKINPEDINTIGVLGNIAIIEKKYTEAQECFEKILLINPNEVKAIFNLAYIFEFQKKYIEAQECFERILSINPENFEALNRLGFSFFLQKKYKDAEKSYKRALKIKPLRWLEQEVLGACLFFQNKYKEALKHLEISSTSKNNKKNVNEDIIYECLFATEQYVKLLTVINKKKFNTKYIKESYNLLMLTEQAIKYNKEYKDFKNTKIVYSLCEYIEIINQIKEIKENTTFVYRGQRNCFYPLLPSLFRTNETKNKEKNIVQDFNIKSDAYFDHELEHFDDVDKLALMQHHGVPTRLLDFSESPLIALYFALEDIKDDDHDKAPCVYVLNLEAFPLNKNGYILSSTQIEVSGENCSLYFKNDKSKGKKMNEYFAFLPKLKNKRLTAQKGVFIAFNDDVPLEKNAQEYLTKIVIPRPCIAKIRKELLMMGVTPTTVYPDFEGLAKEVKTPREFVTTTAFLQTSQDSAEIDIQKITKEVKNDSREFTSKDIITEVSQ